MRAKGLKRIKIHYSSQRLATLPSSNLSVTSEEIGNYGVIGGCVAVCERVPWLVAEQGESGLMQRAGAKLCPYAMPSFLGAVRRWSGLGITIF